MTDTNAILPAGILRRFLSLVALAAAQAAAYAAQPLSDYPVAPERVSRIVAAKAASGEPVDALVLLDDSRERASHAEANRDGGIPERPQMSAAQYDRDVASWALRMGALKSEVRARLAGDDLEELTQYSQFPILHLRVRSAAAMNRLRAHPGVLSIDENRANRTFLSESRPLVGQPTAQAAGFTGAGTTVAVLDTGVDYLNAAFGCTGVNTPSTCKVAYVQDFAPSDGARDAHGHGTNVAGVVVGVAPGAKVAGLDVFDVDGFAYDDDIIAAINWTVTNRATYNIAAINMSLGGGQLFSPVTPSDSWGVAIQGAVNAGITVVAASGNDGYTSSMGLPAAYTNVISVGAVYDANLGSLGWGSPLICTDSTTAADKVTCFSNSASFLTMLAPGAMVTAAGITMGGTSQASPHVAAAAAVVKAANPAYSVAQVKAALLNGTNVTDPRNGVAKPRLNLPAALSTVNATLTVAISGSGTVTSAPAGISCPGTCSASFTTGTSVTLTASPAAGSTFSGWSGACTGTSLSCAVSMTAARSATATFAGPEDNFPPGGLMPPGWMVSPGAFGWAVATDSTYRGVNSLRSAPMSSTGVPQVAATRVTGNFPAGEVSFAYRVSSEPTYDVFEFLVDGVVVHSNSGDKPWTLVSFPVAAGAHVFEWVYRKDGSGDSFANAAWIDAVTLPGGVRRAPMDFNRDGKSDMLYYNVATGQVLRQFMDGTTALSPAIVYTDGNLAWKPVAEADFTGDGVADLLWRNSSTGQVVQMAFDASGVPTSVQAVVSEPDTSWRIVGAPDLDGNGRADILWWNARSGQVYAMLLDGPAIIGAGTVHTEPNTAWRIHGAGDFSGSGKANQVLWRNATTGALYLMTVTYSGGTFGQSGQVFYAATTEWTVAGVADFDGDGKSDVLLRNGRTGVLWALLMNGAVVKAESALLAQPELAWKVAALGDYDGDGRADILMRNESSGEVRMSMVYGLSATPQKTVYSEERTSWRLMGAHEFGGASYAGTVGAVAATDVSGERRADVLYRNASTGQLWVLLMNGLATTASFGANGGLDANWRVVAQGDFNGDGIADLVWRDGVSGQVYYMPFAPGGVPTTGRVVATEPNVEWKILHAPDLDGDGRADLLWWNSSTGQVYAMLMNGGDIVGQGPVMTEPDTAWRIVATGDFSGSGRQNQLLWRHASTGQVFMMTVTVSGDLFGQAGQPIYQEPDTAWKILAAADFDGDGRSDILWRNDATGSVFAMLMNGPAIAAGGIVHVEPDLAWKVVAQGDYDGDGKADLLWRNDATGMVYMMLMNGLAVAAQGVAYGEPDTAWKILGPWEYGQ